MTKFPLYALSGYNKALGIFYKLFAAGKAMGIIMIFFEEEYIIDKSHHMKISPEKLYNYGTQILNYSENTFYCPYLFNELPELTVYYMYDEKKNMFNIEACMPVSKKADRQIIIDICEKLNNDKYFDIILHDDIIISRRDADLNHRYYRSKSTVYDYINMIICFFESNFKETLFNPFCYFATGDKKYLK